MHARMHRVLACTQAYLAAGYAPSLEFLERATGVMLWAPPAPAPSGSRQLGAAPAPGRPGAGLGPGFGPLLAPEQLTTLASFLGQQQRGAAVLGPEQLARMLGLARLQVGSVARRTQMARVCRLLRLSE